MPRFDRGMTRGTKNYIRARVTDESYAGWRRVARTHGVTMAALVEALGRRMAAGESTDLTEELIDEARAVAENRLRRF